MNQNQNNTKTIVVAITAGLGALALVGVGVTALFGGVNSNFISGLLGHQSSEASYDGDGAVQNADGYEELDVENLSTISVSASLASMHVSVADVDLASLRIEKQPDDSNWEMTEQNGALVVKQRDDRSGALKRGIGCVGVCDHGAKVELVLPKAAVDPKRTDMSVQLAAGELTVNGTYRALDLSVSAGSLVFDGATSELAATIKAGEANIHSANTATVDLSADMGQLTAVFTGAAPSDLRAGVNMGELDLTLPAQTYQVDTAGMIGEVDNRLSTTSEAAANKVKIAGAAGEVKLREGR